MTRSSEAPSLDKLNYWDIIDLALSYLPDDLYCKKPAWDSLDHLRGRVGDRQSPGPESIPEETGS